MTSVASWLAENAVGAPEITVRINSYGGVVSDGVGIYNLLAQHPAKITTVVEGFALSAASVIAMAGNEIQMLPGSMLMIHEAWGGCRGNASDMDATANALRKMSEASGRIYADRTGQSLEKCLELMKTETWMNSQEAVTLGFADKAVSGVKKTPPKDGAPSQSAMQFFNSCRNIPEALRPLLSAKPDRRHQAPTIAPPSLAKQWTPIPSALAEGLAK